MGEKRVTVKDIAREAGVSPALVSFVMSNKNAGKRTYRVNEDTAKHILSVAKRLNYCPNASARSLKSGKFNTIGVLFSDISNAFFSEIARIIEDEAYKNHYYVLFGSTDEDSTKLEQLIRVFEDKGVDGLLVVPCAGADNCIKKVAARGVPVVLLDRNIEGDFPSVTLDNITTSFELTNRLIEKGYRRIEMVSYTMNLSNIQGRENGYLKCMSNYGLSSYANIHRLEHHADFKKLDIIIEDARKRSVEAFVFATNTLAVQGMASIFKGGFHVPQDFGIACFDRNDAYEIYDTDLIYAKQPTTRFAQESISILLDYMKTGGIENRDRSVLLVPEIIDTGE